MEDKFLEVKLTLKTNSAEVEKTCKKRFSDVKLEATKKNFDQDRLIKNLISQGLNHQKQIEEASREKMKAKA